MISLTPLLLSLNKEERRKYQAYHDSLGILTIGVGFNIDPNHGGGLDDEEIDFVLQHRVGKAERVCETYPWFSTLSETRQLVIIDLVFNMGAHTFSTFEIAIGYLAAGNFSGAANAFRNSLWDHQVGVRAERLTRIMETDVWET